MNTDEKIKAIRTELKQLGFNNRQISVKKSYLTYETAINIIFKFMPSDELFEKVKSIARKHKEVSYCEVSGELLMGGNTFVDVSIDWKAKKHYEALFLDEYNVTLFAGMMVWKRTEGNDDPLYYFNQLNEKEKNFAYKEAYKIGISLIEEVREESLTKEEENDIKHLFSDFFSKFPQFHTAEDFHLGDKFYFVEFNQTYVIYSIREGINSKIYLHTYDTPKGHREEQNIYQSELKKLISDNKVKEV